MLCFKMSYYQHFIRFINRGLNTIIMSATIDPHPITLKQNVTLRFRNLEVVGRCLYYVESII